MAFQPGAFQPGAFQGAEGEPTGVLAAIFAPVFSAAIAGTPIVAGTFTAGFNPVFGAEATGTPIVTGELAGSFYPTFVASFTGDSEGTIIIIPRDAANGIAYLVEVDAYDPGADAVVTLRFSSDGFNTKPSDSVPNAHFAPHLKQPGNYERTLFGSGGTSGDIEVGAGVTELLNLDGRLDELADYAFDGYPLTIKTVERIRPNYADAVTVFKGTLSQVEFTWQRVSLLIRDRLAALDKPVQETQFAGTTISGGMDEAEGRPDDLKGQPKPLTYGAPLQVSGLVSNIYDRIISFGQNGLDAVEDVRDGGVLLTYSGNDYATVSGLAAATISEGQFSTALDLGLIRTGGEIVRTITGAPVKGATAADRTAAQLARQVMLRMGLVEGGDFRAEDVAALDALNSAEIGYWIGAEERTALRAISDILGSIGATCVPDRLGVFRLYRFDAIAPDTIPVITFGEAEIMEIGRRGIERLATGDQGKGIPAWRINLRYGWNGAVQRREDLDVFADEEYKAFASEEWRTVTAEDETVKDAHRLSPELSFDTYLVDGTAAQAEADRRLALYSVPRERYRVPVKSFLTEQLDLNSVVQLQFDRFGLSAGKLFRVIGMVEDLGLGRTILDVWG